MKFFIGNFEYACLINNFPCGELGVVLPKGMPSTTKSIRIHYNWVADGNNQGIIILAQLVDALTEKYRSQKYHISLLLPYVPYSRQDRRCRIGESFSLRVFSKLINSLEFNAVYTWDNHSEVATDLIHFCINRDAEELMDQNFFHHMKSKDNLVVVSPDQGAAKKTKKIAKFLGCEYVLKATKKRNEITGEIEEVTVPTPYNVDVGTFLVVDDICDGGGTFIGLAEKLLDLKPHARIVLYVTHGFFTKGMNKLLEFYDEIYTTNSVCNIDQQGLIIMENKNV